MRRAWLLEVTPGRWMEIYRRANVLLRAGYEVAWAVEPLREGPRAHPRGTFAVLSDGAPPPAHAADGSAASFGGPVSVEGVLLPLGVARVAVYGGGGAPYNYARILAAAGFIVEFIQPEEIRSGALEDVDVLMMPGGGLQAMKGQLDPLGEEGARAIARWVRAGGMYIGSCAGAFDAALVSPAFVEACPAQACLQMINARVWNGADTEWLGLASPGVGVLRSRVVRPDHPVMFHLPEAFDIVHYNGPLFEPAPDVVPGASEAAGLAVVSGTGGAFTPAEYFLAWSQQPAVLPEETLMARAVAAGVHSVVAGDLEEGRVVLFGSHPEFGTNLVMDSPGPAAVMLANAVLWQSSARPRRTVRLSRPVPPDIRETAALALETADDIASAAQDLLWRPLIPMPPWIEERLAMSTFGLPATRVWEETLAEFPRLLRELGDQLRRLDVAAGALNGPEAPEAIATVAAMLAYRAPSARDFGFEGLPQALARSRTMLQRARDQWAFEPPPSSNPYQWFEESPYHQAVGSYLAASGVLAAACALASAAADTLEALREVEAIRSPGAPVKG